jgi:sulfur relay (sulfurtransferase) complex TusBCD TusD component (DsrE family)
MIEPRRQPVSAYLLIESRDPFANRDVERSCELAAQLTKAGHEVTLFLVQNGVFCARSGSHRMGIENVLATRTEVLADEFSLRERGIAVTALLGGVRPAPLNAVVERLCAGWKVLWR